MKTQNAKLNTINTWAVLKHRFVLRNPMGSPQTPGRYSWHAFCSASVRKHWTGAAREGHRPCGFIAKYAYCLHQNHLAEWL